jgi:hypothetical protein
LHRLIGLNILPIIERLQLEVSIIVLPSLWR